jgi:hypothetical protein
LDQGDSRGLNYLIGLGAVTGGAISGTYLVYAVSSLANPADLAPIALGLLTAFLGATLLNTIGAGLFMELMYGRATGISDYGVGALIGTAVTYLTVLSYVYNTT